MRKDPVVLPLAALVAVVLSAILTFSTLAALFKVSNDASNSYKAAYAAGYGDGKASMQEVEDEQGEMYPPLLLQEDPQWASEPYGDGTIGSHGCGLVCASIVISSHKGELVDPAYLAKQQSGSFITGGINDPDKICRWVEQVYGLEWSGEQWGFESVRSLLEEGWLVIAGVSGAFGTRTYGGHLVLLHSYGDDGCYVRDPDDGANSVRKFSWQELEQVSWGSINGLR